MNRNIIPLLLAILFLLASCGRVNTSRDNTQARMDSMVNAKVDSAINRMKMKNDSIINAKANAKAQEIISGMKR